MITGQNPEPWADLMKESLEAIDGTRGNPDMPTLRDQFAMAALTAAYGVLLESGHFWPRALADQAYKIADAMMEARKG